MKESDIKIGQHFWAMVDGKLVAIMKDSASKYYVCGAWECSISFNEIAFLYFIDMPKEFKVEQLYYF